jgi:hypothetical protein
MSKLGTGSFAASAAFFLAKAILDLVIGPLPSSGAEILAWAASHQVLLAAANEAFFLGAMLLVPATIALRARFDRCDTAAAVGCALVAVTVPICAVLAIVHGRLVYPVYGLRTHTPEVAELVAALYFGGMHAVALVFAVATVALSLAMRRGARKGWVACLEYASAALDVVGAYPDAIGPAAKFVVDVVFVAWLLTMSMSLLRARSSARRADPDGRVRVRKRGPVADGALDI